MTLVEEPGRLGDALARDQGPAAIVPATSSLAADLSAFLGAELRTPRGHVVTTGTEKRGLDRHPRPERDRVEGRLAGHAPDHAHGRGAHPRAPSDPARLGPRGDGDRVRRLHVRVHRQRLGHGADPAPRPARGGQVDRLLGQRSDRARSYRRRRRSRRARGRLLRRTGGSLAVRRVLRRLRRQRARDDPAGAPRPRDAVPPARAAPDRRDARRCGDRHHDRGRGIRRLGNRRSAARRSDHLDDAALGVDAVETVARLLDLEPAATRRVRGQRLRPEHGLAVRAQPRRDPDRTRRWARRHSARTRSRRP